ncbi:flagellar protein FlaG [Shewanella sp. A25]|nr:flagellar protein FlaG [Shewanella shenzhenensis]
MDVLSANVPSPVLSRDNLPRPPTQANDAVNNVTNSQSATSQAQKVAAATNAAQAMDKKQQESDDKGLELQQAVENISASMDLIQKGLAFKIDEELGEPIVRVIDVTTGDLIRQIPNEEALEIAKKLNEVTGLLMKTEV